MYFENRNHTDKALAHSYKLGDAKVGIASPKETNSTPAANKVVLNFFLESGYLP